MNELLPLLEQYNSLTNVEDQNEMLSHLNEILESNAETSFKSLVDIIKYDCNDKILSLALVLVRSRIPKKLPFPFNEDNNPLLKFNTIDVLELFSAVFQHFANVNIRDQAIYTFSNFAIAHDAFFDDSEIIQELVKQDNENILIKDAIAKILFNIIDEVTVSEEKTLVILEFVKSCFSCEVTNDTIQFCIDILRVLVKFLPQEFCAEIRPFIIDYTANPSFSTKCCKLWSSAIMNGSFLFSGDRDIISYLMGLLTAKGHPLSTQHNALFCIHSFYSHLKLYEAEPVFDEFTLQILNTVLEIINKITDIENDEENLFLVARFVVISILDNFTEECIGMLFDWANENENIAAALQVFGAISYVSKEAINQYEVVENVIASEDPFVILKLMEFIDDNSYCFQEEEANNIVEGINPLLMNEENSVAENVQKALIALFPYISIEAAQQSIVFYLEMIGREEIPSHSNAYFINCMTSILNNIRFVELSNIFIEGETPIIQQLIELFDIESNEIMSLCTLLSQIAINTSEGFELLVEYSVAKLTEVINHSFSNYGIDALAKICVSVPINQELLSHSIGVIVEVMSREPTCDELFYSFKAISLICQKFSLPEEIAGACVQAAFGALSDEYFNFEYKEAAFDLLSKLYSRGFLQSEETIEKMKVFILSAISNLIDLFNQDADSTSEMAIYIIEILIQLIQNQHATASAAILLLDQIHSFDSESLEDCPRFLNQIGLLMIFISNTFKGEAAFLENYTDIIDLLAEIPETSSLSQKILTSIEKNCM